ncbi:hypothetical protein [Gordonia rhizosphera]|uniref:Uncharacterized protein n=1 Tax=Gordonia rhizosphera NBRC 16068 TaxID=1108045 RepID=K6WRQ9_9ACTN|nr:hypothetical protein [Gordonia rhizosphera]GAB89239.1 hypothetical protein GORHZ_055_00220 [Gordonia rhizosphera NBRC 16068]
MAGATDPADADGVLPLPSPVALWRLLSCAVTTAILLLTWRVHLPRHNVGHEIPFADGTVGRVYRETVLDLGKATEPVTLIVGFRLRWVGSNRFAHRLFRIESLLNTPLFVGFPGFVSKLWIAHDGNNVYRGVYEWDREDLAHRYVRALWWPLALVSERASIRYHVVPGSRRDATLSHIRLRPGEQQWWHPLTTDPPPRVQGMG